MPGTWDGGHIDDTPLLTWGTRATKGGTFTPTFGVVGDDCANVYCHGAGMADAIADPDWTGGTAACALPPRVDDGRPAA